MKTPLGIDLNFESRRKNEINVNPYFFNELAYCRGHQIIDGGKTEVEWKREDNNIILFITVPENLKVNYKGNILKSGKNVINVNGGKI
jgi:hypothetical protein